MLPNRFDAEDCAELLRHRDSLSERPAEVNEHVHAAERLVESLKATRRDLRRTLDRLYAIDAERSEKGGSMISTQPAPPTITKEDERSYARFLDLITNHLGHCFRQGMPFREARDSVFDSLALAIDLDPKVDIDASNDNGGAS